MKNKMLFTIVFFGIPFHAVAMEDEQPTQLARRASFDSPRRSHNSTEFQQQATSFLVSLNQSTEQREELLVAQLLNACRSNNIETAKKTHEELEKVNSWNRKNREQREADFQQAKNSYIALLQEAYQKQNQVKQSTQTSIATAAAQATLATVELNSPEDTQSLSRQRSFSLSNLGGRLRKSGGTKK